VLAGAPSSPEIVYAFSRTTLFRSTDTGTSWNLQHEFPAYYSTVTSVAVSRTNPYVVFLTLPGADVLKTTNGGKTWTTIPPDPTRLGSDYRLTIFDGEVETLIASTKYAGTAAARYIIVFMEMTTKRRTSLLCVEDDDRLIAGFP